jgi:signal transduction histidine kinase
LSVFPESDGAIVQVSDTGIGIPKADQSRIFERFYQVDKSRSKKVGGSGLGLSIVKHIVQSHGGSIDLKSSPGSGTTIRIKLPK